MQSELKTSVASAATASQLPATCNGPTPIPTSLLQFIGGGKAPTTNLLPVNKWS